jgi:hypothetical protein
MSTPSEARGRTNRDLGDAPTRPSSQSSVLKTGGETDRQHRYSDSRVSRTLKED